MGAIKVSFNTFRTQVVDGSATVAPSELTKLASMLTEYWPTLAELLVLTVI